MLRELNVCEHTRTKCGLFYHMNISTMGHVTFTCTSWLPCQRDGSGVTARGEGCQARDHCLGWLFNICEHETMGYFWRDVGTFSSCLCGNKRGCFWQFPAMFVVLESGKQEHNLTLTKCFLCINLNISKAQCWNIIIKLHDKCNAWTYL